MRWFKPEHSVCKECGIHYEPVIGHEARWGDLCPVHRKSVMEKDLRKDAVVSWAFVNWEKLEAMYLEEKKKEVDTYQKYSQENLAAMANAQQDGRVQRSHYSVLGGLGRMGL